MWGHAINHQGRVGPQRTGGTRYGQRQDGVVASGVLNRAAVEFKRCRATEVQICRDIAGLHGVGKGQRAGARAACVNSKTGNGPGLQLQPGCAACGVDNDVFAECDMQRDDFADPVVAICRGGSDGTYRGLREAEKNKRIAASAYHGIQGTIPIDIHKNGIGIDAYIRQVKGVGEGGSKGRAAGRAGVHEDLHIAITVANQGIQVTVCVQVHKTGARVVAYIVQAIRIGDGGGKCRAAGCASVQKKVGGAGMVANKSVNIAIGIHIHKSGRGNTEHLAQAIGVDEGCRKGRATGCARVQENLGIAIRAANQGIQVTISIDVCKAGAGAGTCFAQAKGVGEGIVKSRAAGRARVQEKKRVAGIVADKGIQVTIAVDVHQAGAGIGSHICQTIRVGAGRHKNR